MSKAETYRELADRYGTTPEALARGVRLVRLLVLGFVASVSLLVVAVTVPGARASAGWGLVSLVVSLYLLALARMLRRSR